MLSHADTHAEFLRAVTQNARGNSVVAIQMLRQLLLVASQDLETVVALELMKLVEAAGLRDEALALAERIQVLEAGDVPPSVTRVLSR